MRKATPATATLDIAEHQTTDILKAIFATALEANYSVAFWQLPGDNYQQVIIDRSAKPVKPKIDLENMGTGFLFAPFDHSKHSLFLNADVYYNTKKNVLRTNEIEASGNKIHRDIRALLRNNSADSTKKRYYQSVSIEHKGSTEKGFRDIVKHSIEAIQNGHFHKVVPARKLIVDLSDNFHPIDTFLDLCRNYAHALVSMVSIPNVGTWLGASPETLVSISKDQLFTTAALAGTQEQTGGTDHLEVAWRQKEIEEQAMVSRYIINCFKKIRLREFEEVGPMTVRAGNLWHLKTTYHVDMNAVNFPQLGTVMLDLLHPTSAVCGLPQKEARNFLSANEDFNREYFSGYLGPVNVENASDVFVNLRCMQLLEKQAILYAGAGVTAHSDAAKEWAETNLKCQTMLKVLEK